MYLRYPFNRLECVVEKPQFIKMPDSLTVHDYAEVLTKVRASGVPKPEIKWTKNGEPLDLKNKDSSKPLITIESSNDTHISSDLLFKHFAIDDSAEYAAIAYNISGETVAPFKLSLEKTPPSFDKKLERLVEVGEEEALHLTCHLIGSPIPIVHWYKNGEPLPASDQ